MFWGKSLSSILSYIAWTMSDTHQHIFSSLHALSALNLSQICTRNLCIVNQWNGEDCFRLELSYLFILFKLLFSASVHPHVDAGFIAFVVALFHAFSTPLDLTTCAIVVELWNILKPSVFGWQSFWSIPIFKTVVSKSKTSTYQRAREQRNRCLALGGFLKWGYTLKSSIYRWFFLI